jgi:Pyruvate/2-oxoacid:ferredoxin oxidoreductase gamma subunit
MVALGAFIEATKMVNTLTISRGLEWVLPKHRSSLIPLNRAAFKAGIEHVRRIKKR